MKEYEYYMYSPGGNDTALVLKGVKNSKTRKIISDKIMEENLNIEQVGFIDTDSNKLTMAGGEFCGNATRCAIYEFLKGREGKIDIEVSGCGSMLYGGIIEGNVYMEYPHCS